MKHAIAVYSSGFALCLILVAGVEASKHVHGTVNRADIVNATLDQVLLVGSDFTEQGKHPTWGDIDKEVARRMNVQRKSP